MCSAGSLVTGHLSLASNRPVSSSLPSGGTTGLPNRLEVEPARAGEHRVADLLAFQAAAGEMPEQEILGVVVDRRAAGHARHPVRVREHDQPVQVLEAPAVVDQVAGEEVEQLGVGRLLALLAEVVGRAHDRPPEVPAPDAVGQHPRHQRVLG